MHFLVLFIDLMPLDEKVFITHFPVDSPADCHWSGMGSGDLIVSNVYHQSAPKPG
jgi:hypothetical protein